MPFPFFDKKETASLVTNENLLGQFCLSVTLNFTTRTQVHKNCSGFGIK
jgi:hypothetical protein